MATDRSYDYTARYYYAVYEAAAAARKDAAFYESLAVETGGPVLELGCGTGRALLPIAARGLECAGLDASSAMIAQCRAKPGGAALILKEGRMEDFDFGPRKFALIFAAFRVFQHLDTVEQQLACLARVRAHLAPGGLLPSMCSIRNRKASCARWSPRCWVRRFSTKDARRSASSPSRAIPSGKSCS